MRTDWRVVAAAALLCQPVLVGVPAARAAAPVEVERRNAVVRVVEQVSPAVVNISSEEIVRGRRNPFGRPIDPFFEEFFRDFFEPGPPRYRETSLGSGVVIDPKGYILTNAHVIERAARIRVTFADGREFVTELVGADPEGDLAVLRVPADRPLPAVSMGRSSDLMIGETVIAIGNPFGLSHTVTTGVVSALNRSLTTGERVFRDFIQTDASINPGNSGGPLLNIRGELIGINTAIYGKAQGIGFAIPIDRARRVVSDLIAFGEVVPVWVGVVLGDPPAARAADRDAAARGGRAPSDGGLPVLAVEPGSPAAAAGLRPGDQIVGLNGWRPADREGFEQAAALLPRDRPSTLAVVRDGAQLTLSLTPRDYPPEVVDRLVWARLGVRVAPAEDHPAGSAAQRGPRSAGNKRRAAPGLVVTAVREGSPAGEIGLEPGDLIRRVDEAEIGGLAEFRRAMVRAAARGRVLLVVVRDRAAYAVPLSLLPAPHAVAVR